MSPGTSEGQRRKVRVLCLCKAEKDKKMSYQYSIPPKKSQYSRQSEEEGDNALQMKLHRSEAAARELRSGLDSERENSLDWMERHNKERDKVI